MMGNCINRKNVIKYILVTGFCSLSITGCMKKEDLFDPTQGKGGDEVTLDNYFDFSTTKTVQLNVDYGKDCPKAYFEVYAENPLIFQEEGSQVLKKEGILPIASGFANGTGVYNKKGTIPASVTEVYIYSPDFGVPTLYKTSVDNGVINAAITFENEIDLSALSSRSAQSRATKKFITDVIPNVLGTWNGQNGRPDYLNDNTIEIDKSLKKYITTYFPEKRKNIDSPYISDDSDILIKKPAHVSLNYFGGTTEAQCVFAYYCYPAGATKDEIKKAAENACVIFPNAHENALGKYSGVGVDLKYIDQNGSFHSDDNIFPAGIKIGFLIWNDAWNQKNNTANQKHIFYSTKSLNKTGRSHTAIFAAKNANGKKYNVISMEDWNANNLKDPDYNDVAFIISSDPVEAIEVPIAPDPGERKGTEKYQGLLGFEDNWPEQGDYDMNDVIIKYASDVDYNSENKVIQITDKITLAWTGADYRNGFSYEVPFDLSKAKVTVIGGENSSVSGNVIHVFTDAKKELGVSGIGAGDMPSQDVKEKNFTVTMTFNNPDMDKSEVVPPYNPFISIGSTEVHLTDHKPTAGANNTFPQGADIADGKDHFFVCKDGFPFAIHLDARADQSILNIDLRDEQVRIDEVYPKFKDWAKDRDPSIKWWKK